MSASVSPHTIWLLLIKCVSPSNNLFSLIVSTEGSCRMMILRFLDTAVLCILQQRSDNRTQDCTGHHQQTKTSAAVADSQDIAAVSKGLPPSHISSLGPVLGDMRQSRLQDFDRRGIHDALAETIFHVYIPIQRLKVKPVVTNYLV